MHTHCKHTIIDTVYKLSAAECHEVGELENS